MAASSHELLTSLLKEVSRSFYLTLRVLPGSIRPQIGLAYLLARATDTIADTEIIPLADRLNALQAMEDNISGKSSAPLQLDEFVRLEAGTDEDGTRRREENPTAKGAASRPTNSAGAFPLSPTGGEGRGEGAVSSGGTVRRRSAPTSGERDLLERIEEILLLLNQFSSADQHLIRQVLQTIVSGQALDLERFAGARPDRIVLLQTEEELDDYTYRVAGSVGEFWTRICRSHVFPAAPLDESTLLVNGVRFGKGLQLVNILRDFPADLRNGRCYLPAEAWQRFGLSPATVLEATQAPAFRRLYQSYLTQAEGHLAAGWIYTNALPRRCVRVRLACSWPILIGVRTVERLRASNVLDAAHPIKVPRAEVRKIMARSLLYYPWPKAWNRLFERAQRAGQT